MNGLTYKEQVAYQLGYPARHLCYSPNDPEYWTNPSVGWVDLPLAEVDFDHPERGQRGPAGLFLHVFRMWNEEMAPRLRAGTVVAGRPVETGDPLSAGSYLAWVDPGDPPGRFQLAQLTKVDWHCLTLTYLNRKGKERVVTIPWWPTDPGRPVFRITHYVSQPVISLPEPAAGQPPVPQPIVRALPRAVKSGKKAA